MADYKPQFRPIYNFGKKSLVEKISDTFYDSFKDKSWKEIKDDNVTSIIKDFSDPYIVTMATGVAVSIVANGVTAHIEDVHGYAHKAIEHKSFWAEILVHAFFSTGAFVTMCRKKGMSWGKTSIEVGKLFLATTPIALGPYPPIRNFVADVYMNNGFKPEYATPLAQLTFLPFYVGAVKYSVKKIMPKAEMYVKEVVYPKLKICFKNKKHLMDDKQSIDVQKDIKPSNLEETVEIIERAS